MPVLFNTTPISYSNIKVKQTTQKCFYTLMSPILINASPSSAAYMRLWTGTALIQLIACCLFGATLLPELVLAYCPLAPGNKC